MADGILKEGRIDNLPLEKPKFNLVDITKAIPKHCFERSLSVSLIFDFQMVSNGYYYTTSILVVSYFLWSGALESSYIPYYLLHPTP
jgi:hypothetical protein